MSTQQNYGEGANFASPTAQAAQNKAQTFPSTDDWQSRFLTKLNRSRFAQEDLFNLLPIVGDLHETGIPFQFMRRIFEYWLENAPVDMNIERKNIRDFMGLLDRLRELGERTQILNNSTGFLNDALGHE
ncbi:hypothetical protein F5984_15145 [Rudanella paleaurantiibacter]|uniref:Uncharacterized protein n=1 Tax=Rudanella paleaurantiibacter TaxID=2614655 RepID=A0A7J5TZC3_9BACT|nr:hypothetical protein [Rudanella paleaurantiibacter]KAB7730476.1 hypothetical protein F5984_15145 [Rudanella paleaurantiibacter]